MNGHCDFHTFERAVDVCGICYGDLCRNCALPLKGRKDSVCKDCALAVSGVRGGSKPEVRGDRRTVKQRRQEYAAAGPPEDFFQFFDADLPDDALIPPPPPAPKGDRQKATAADSADGPAEETGIKKLLGRLKPDQPDEEAGEFVAIDDILGQRDASGADDGDELGQDADAVSQLADIRRRGRARVPDLNLSREISQDDGVKTDSDDSGSIASVETETPAPSPAPGHDADDQEVESAHLKAAPSTEPPVAQPTVAGLGSPSTPYPQPQPDPELAEGQGTAASFPVESPNRQADQGPLPFDPTRQADRPAAAETAADESAEQPQVPLDTTSQHPSDQDLPAVEPVASTGTGHPVSPTDHKPLRPSDFDDLFSGDNPVESTDLGHLFDTVGRQDRRRQLRPISEVSAGETPPSDDLAPSGNRPSQLSPRLQEVVDELSGRGKPTEKEANPFRKRNRVAEPESIPDFSTDPFSDQGQEPTPVASAPDRRPGAAAAAAAEPMASGPAAPIVPDDHPPLYHPLDNTEPTYQPLDTPAPEPTYTPLDTPAPEPTVVEPNYTPTIEPAVEPTYQPLDPPAAEPTYTSTVEPAAAEHTYTPLDTPAPEPTVVEPNYTPTIEPAAEPTYQPLDPPAAEPTYTPLDPPAAEPTYTPLDTPATEPTYTPTIEPAAEPTYQPLDPPAAEPTYQPLDPPAAEPTYQPLDPPATEPTYQPLDTPAVEPAAGMEPSIDDVLPPLGDQLFNSEPVRGIDPPPRVATGFDEVLPTNPGEGEAAESDRVWPRRDLPPPSMGDAPTPTVDDLLPPPDTAPPGHSLPPDVSPPAPAPAPAVADDDLAWLTGPGSVTTESFAVGSVEMNGAEPPPLDAADAEPVELQEDIQRSAEDLAGETPPPPGSTVLPTVDDDSAEWTVMDDVPDLDGTTSKQRADIDARGSWIPPALRGIAPDAAEAAENLPRRQR